MKNSRVLLKNIDLSKEYKADKLIKKPRVLLGMATFCIGWKGSHISTMPPRQERVIPQEACTTYHRNTFPDCATALDLCELLARLWDTRWE